MKIDELIVLILLSVFFFVPVVVYIYANYFDWGFTFICLGSGALVLGCWWESIQIKNFEGYAQSISDNTNGQVKISYVTKTRSVSYLLFSIDCSGLIDNQITIEYDWFGGLLRPAYSLFGLNYPTIGNAFFDRWYLVDANEGTDIKKVLTSEVQKIIRELDLSSGSKVFLSDQGISVVLNRNSFFPPSDKDQKMIQRTDMLIKMVELIKQNFKST